MKRMLIVSFFCFSFSVISLMANDSFSFVYKTNKTTKSEPIHLKGTLSTKGLERRSGGDPISALLERNSIQVIFHKRVGVLSVTIADDSGSVILENRIDSSMEQVVIPLFGLSSGKYTITFSNDGGAMYGDFEIND